MNGDRLENVETGQPMTVALTELVYTYVDTMEPGLKRDLVDFAGECLEAALFDHDEENRRAVVLKLLDEIEAMEAVDLEEKGG
jgi:hypothetical protein